MQQKKEILETCAKLSEKRLCELAQRGWFVPEEDFSLANALLKVHPKVKNGWKNVALKLTQKVQQLILVRYRTL